MVLKKLSRSVAAVATVAMMVSPMMAMAANSPAAAPTAKDLVDAGKAEVTFDENGNVASLKVTDPAGAGKDGVLPITQNGGVAYLIIKNGEWDKTFTSKQADKVTPVTVDGEDFIADQGVVMTWVNGAVTFADGAYFVAAGKIVKEETVAEYKGEWFAIKDGKVDTTVTGPKTFKDAKGTEVTGLFAAGRMIKEFDGITDDGKNSYYVSSGIIRTDLNGVVATPIGSFEFKNGVVVK